MKYRTLKSTHLRAHFQQRTESIKRSTMRIRIQIQFQFLMHKHTKDKNETKRKLCEGCTRPDWSKMFASK